jgi:Raffinose synthase or seed imbibition protein Sip1
MASVAASAAAALASPLCARGPQAWQGPSPSERRLGGGEASCQAGVGYPRMLMVTRVPSAAQLVFRRFLASARSKLWWSTPEWGVDGSDVPPETQFLLAELREGGPYAILLPLIDGGTFRATLRPPAAGDTSVVLRIESGDDTVVASEWKGAGVLPFHFRGSSRGFCSFAPSVHAAAACP